ncbi:putative RNA polymerase II subunit B1 CTD phosphatase RPAP2 like [Pseudolycoriella hygida]|uniref:RNA polymerase II subunit B1 CTD phosphatase RPAP2 homolog n=1 Tax=Pseudolycoriella hygida TaxID=35572 RepID=A0A9Q0NE86_9DIPT|nr:putative RNA polymerase II subunit B1 CTD phosphatase RPAP2 like [Pseudolycoriella hygida]
MATIDSKSSNQTIKSPRSLRSNKKNRISKLSKEQLDTALKKKRECNRKALKVVEELIDQHIDQDLFLEKLKDINQCHYDDIVDERSITKLCGYPLCKEFLTNVPVKQYYISTATNTVYDITERKKFCNNSCFKSSNYLKDQLLTSPLWLRDQEILPKIKLLPHRSGVKQENETLEKLSLLTIEDSVVGK